MGILLLTFIILAVVMLIMSIGVLMGGKPVQGSCGGLNKIDGMSDCEICGGNPARCEDASSR